MKSPKVSMDCCLTGADPGFSFRGGGGAKDYNALMPITSAKSEVPFGKRALEALGVFNTF